MVAGALALVLVAVILLGVSSSRGTPWQDPCSDGAILVLAAVILLLMLSLS